MLTELSLQWPFLLIWFDFDPSMDKFTHAQLNMGLINLSPPELQRLHQKFENG